MLNRNLKNLLNVFIPFYILRIFSNEPRIIFCSLLQSQKMIFLFSPSFLSLSLSGIHERRRGFDFFTTGKLPNIEARECERDADGTRRESLEPEHTYTCTTTPPAPSGPPPPPHIDGFFMFQWTFCLSFCLSFPSPYQTSSLPFLIFIYIYIDVCSCEVSGIEGQSF